MTTYRTKEDCGCPPVITGTGQKRPEECACGFRYLTEKELAKLKGGRDRQVMGAGSGSPSKSWLRAPSTSGATADYATGQPPKRRKGLKRGRGLSASPEQQAKVRDLACINCGRDRFEVTITAMHVYPRRFVACSCADGVVSGCVECHPLYEEKKIDLLPLLVAHKFHKELVHAVVVHEAPILHVLEIVTGTAWEPVAAREMAA